MLTEARNIILMLTAAVAGICFLDWILRNATEALGEMKADAELRAGEARNVERRPSVSTHSHGSHSVDESGL